MVIADLVHLVAQLALAEEATGDCTDVECLGDAVDDIDTDDNIAERPVHGDADAVALAWHAVGTVHASTIACRVCGAHYEDDDESADVPACPECGAPDMWESRQGASFRALIGEIDGCASLVELAKLGKRLYALELSYDEARVAWTHYTLRKAALESAITLGAAGRALMLEIERASARALAALGARLYRRQHGHDVGAAPEEWRRIWRAYHTGRAARAA